MSDAEARTSEKMSGGKNGTLERVSSAEASTDPRVVARACGCRSHTIQFHSIRMK